MASGIRIAFRIVAFVLLVRTSVVLAQQNPLSDLLARASENNLWKHTFKRTVDAELLQMKKSDVHAVQVLMVDKDRLRREWSGKG